VANSYAPPVAARQARAAHPRAALGRPISPTSLFSDFLIFLFIPVFIFHFSLFTFEFYFSFLFLFLVFFVFEKVQNFKIC
jgi:hypothetical protein